MSADQIVGAYLCVGAVITLWAIHGQDVEAGNRELMATLKADIEESFNVQVSDRVLYGLLCAMCIILIVGWPVAVMVAWIKGTRI